MIDSALEAAVEELRAGSWRERKAASETLARLAREMGPDHEQLADLRQRLLDGLVAPEGVDGRAACHEVLVALGTGGATAVRDRLRDTDPITARRLIDLLAELGDHDDVPMLVDIVRDGASDANLRASAAAALGSLGGPQAQEALVSLLSDPSEVLRVYALDALRAARSVVPVEVLEPLVDAPFYRPGVAALLGRAGDVAALPVLLRLLVDDLSSVRAAACRALVSLEESLQQRGRPRIVAAAVERADDVVRASLRLLCEHSDRDVRIAAVRLCTLAHDAEAVPAVLAAMEDPLLHEAALNMIAELGPAGAERLRIIADDVDPVSRPHLFRLVGAVPADVVDKALRNHLVAALDDADAEVALAGAESLATVGDRSCLGGLYRAMGRGGAIGEAAAGALASVLVRLPAAGQDDLDLIVGAAWPQTGALAENLCRVVGKIGSARWVPHLVAMLGAPEVRVRMAAAAALGQLPGEHEGTSALTLCLADEEPSVRAAACRSLGQLGASSACNSLLGATSDPSPMVRSAAVTALVSLDNPITLARLRAIVAEDAVPTVIVQAIAGLGRSGLDQDLTMLMSLCMSADHEVTKAAARALRSFSAHRATAALLGLLEHERWDVRWAAAEVLGQRTDRTALAPLRALALREQDPIVRQALADAVTALGGERER